MNFPTDEVKRDILDSLNLTDLYKTKGMTKEEKEKTIKDFKEVREKMNIFKRAGIISQARLNNTEKTAIASAISEKIEKIRSEIYAAAALYAFKGGNIAFSEYVLEYGENADPAKLLKAQAKAMVIGLDECLEVAKELGEEITGYLYIDYIDIINAVLVKDEDEEEEVKEEKEEENPLITLLNLLSQSNEKKKEKQEAVSKSLPEKKQKTSFADYAKDFI